MEEKD